MDLERTGLSPTYGHRIIEICLVHVSPKAAFKRSFEMLLNSGCDLGPVRIHQIRGWDVAGPSSFADDAGTLVDLLDGSEHERPENATACVEHALDQWSAIIRTALSFSSWMERTIKVVTGVLTKPGDRALTCRRAPGRPGADRWEFAGGKVERGEPAAEALRRELGEQFGLDVVDREPILRSIARVGSVDLDLATRRVTWTADGLMSSADHHELCWVLPVELGSLGRAKPDPQPSKILSSVAATA